MDVILASGSPRRKELLSQIGLEFSVKVSNAEEIITSSNPQRVVEELSEQKAMAVARELQEQSCLVIGADTVVACDGQILGKPGSEEEAVKMLELLSGRRHQVYTGVTLIWGMEDSQRYTFSEETIVEFYEMSGEEIADYVSTKDPLDKAGAYGIQGYCARYIKGIEGDYFNVVGLPVGKLYQAIKKYAPEVLKL